MSHKYVLKQVGTREEMDRLFEVIWEANYTPYDPVAQLFFPVLGYQASDVSNAKAEAKQRFWDNHLRMGEPSNWLYVEETATGQMVGCSQWEVHLQNPFPHPMKSLDAPWWPQGTRAREFCEQVLGQVYHARSSWMSRPHLALNWMCCIPSHRRKGVGSILMQWGVDKAEDLGLEAYMEASAMGKPLYERFGFRVLFKIAYDTTRPDADDEWRRLEHELTPPPFHAMWRPAPGAGENAKMPWELGKAVQP